MCFVCDADWYARVVEDDIRPAEADTYCGECGDCIDEGKPARRIYQQEHELCPICDGDVPCEECGQGVGETFETWRCLDCDRFLEAVEAAEIEEGCNSYEARPPLEEMLECIQGAGKAEAAKYARKAVAMYPDLRRHVGRLWRTMFGKAGG